MTPSSDQPTRRTWTPAERKRAVKAYHARGERTVAAVAAEIGVGVPLLYFWIRKAAEGSLDATPGKSTAITVAQPKSTAITLAASQRRTGPGELDEHEREELARLRVEVRRLRRAIVVAYELKLEPDDDYRH